MTDTTLRFSARPVVLCVLDGWGYRSETADNAVALANTPNFDRLWAGSPRALLKTSGLDVGLPDGQMGNSEVGHMNIGAGRVVMQDLPRIDQAVESGAFASNPQLIETLSKIKAAGGACHVMGLLSKGGVHSHQRHMAAVARAAAEHGLDVWIHGFLDGRDTPPRSAQGYVETLANDLSDLSGVRFATISGRYYPMDRDKRWERTALGYTAITGAVGKAATDWRQAIANSYADDVSDEFVLPTVIAGYRGMEDGDGVIMINFRADRVRQILAALLDPDFDGFDRPNRIKLSAVAGMVEYSTDLNALMPALFPPEVLNNTIGEIVARAGLKQLRIAETEKHPHVTYFLNGGREAVFENEERILIPSPKVATYDLKPEMSAAEVTEALTAEIRGGQFAFIVINYANPDMVGHSGQLDAAIKAVETVDQGLGALDAAVRDVGGVMLVTADHGNAEMLRDPDTGGPHTSHTTGPVPLLLANAEVLETSLSLADGRLADLAPTALALLGLDQPAEMTGHSLLRPGTHGASST